jgi:exosortase/archaeosortase family protein
MLPGNSLEIAEECSGVGSTMFLLLMSIVVSHFYLHKWWSRLSLVVLIFPISTVKNALRVFTLGVVGSYIDPMVLESKLHQYSGALFFILSLTMLYVSLCLLAWFERLAGPREVGFSSDQSRATTWNHK